MTRSQLIKKLQEIADSNSDLRIDERDTIRTAIKFLLARRVTCSKCCGVGGWSNFGGQGTFWQKYNRCDGKGEL